MKVKIFKPGDRFRLRTGGPVMTVQRYTQKYNPVAGKYESSDTVECTWYGPEGINESTVHQQSLIKARDRKHNLFYPEDPPKSASSK